MTWFDPQPLLLPEVITNNGRWLADKPALICDGTTLNWRDFAAATNRVASALRHGGLGTGDRVAVVMDNSSEMAIALFGIIRAGAVAVPLNVSISDEAIANMVNDSDARAIFASSAHRQRIDGLRDDLPSTIGERYVLVGQQQPDWLAFDDWQSAASSEPTDIKITADDECNIIYSSGTTGMPKGIVHDHRARAAWAYDMAVGLRYHSGARTLCSLGLYSNISWVAMLATILAGGTLIIMRRFDAKACLELMQAQRVSHTTMVPVQLQRMLALDDFDTYDLSSLRSLMCCGSPLPPIHKRRIVAGLGNAFMELYGLTEGLVTILSPEDMHRKTESVGLPCPGQDIRILDNNDNLCANGQPGEIVGRGPLMMAGYHNRPDENAASTWIDEAGNKWLRTGDIGKLDDDGFLYLVDRKKDMIISGGQNIFPADIEAHIVEHDDVAEVAVIGVPSERWGETPVAIVVQKNAIEADALQAWINARVGKQQRVAAVRFIDELPRNPNGKVLKRELRLNFGDLQL
ncbi:MAG: AMP-binding protein [Pseudomonadota bacterium]